MINEIRNHNNRNNLKGMTSEKSVKDLFLYR